MNVLILGPNQNNAWNWGHQHFRNAIARHADVEFYGYGWPNFTTWNVLDILDEYDSQGKNFDIIICEGPKYAGPFEGLHEIDDILKICLCVDYTGDRIGMYNAYMNRCGHDIAVVHNQFIQTDVLEQIKLGNLSKRVIPITIPYAVDTDIYTDQDMERIYDVSAIFSTTSWAYPLRGQIKDHLRSKDCKLEAIVGGDPKERILHHAYVISLNQSKIAINSNCIFGQLNMKYTEAMACNCLLLTDRPKDMSISGFIDGVHLVLYDGLEDLWRKVDYYLQHEQERLEIADRGMRFTRKHYSTDAQAKIFVDHLEWRLSR